MLVQSARDGVYTVMAFDFESVGSPRCRNGATTAVKQQKQAELLDPAAYFFLLPIEE